MANVVGIILLSFSNILLFLKLTDHEKDKKKIETLLRIWIFGSIFGGIGFVILDWFNGNVVVNFCIGVNIISYIILGILMLVQWQINLYRKKQHEINYEINRIDKEIEKLRKDIR